MIAQAAAAVRAHGSPAPRVLRTQHGAARRTAAWRRESRVGSVDNLGRWNCFSICCWSSRVGWPFVSFGLEESMCVFVCACRVNPPPFGSCGGLTKPPCVPARLPSPWLLVIRLSQHETVVVQATGLLHTPSVAPLVLCVHRSYLYCQAILGVCIC